MESDEITIRLSGDEIKDRSNIIAIAHLIQKSIKEYYEENPSEITEQNAQKYALGKVMRFGRGIYNPETIKSLILLERSCFPENVYLRC